VFCRTLRLTPTKHAHGDAQRNDWREQDDGSHLALRIFEQGYIWFEADTLERTQGDSKG